jgi:enoyl-CoA hydratase/carnithine racemase
LTRHDADFARELRDAVVDLADDDYVKVIVLRATARDFCPTVPPAPAHREDIWTTWHQAFGTSSSLYQSMTFCKKLVVTEVAGESSGAGSLLALCSDLTVAATDAAFGSPFAQIPEANFVLAALTMRLNRAKAWLVRDSQLSAQEALAAGLVNRLADRAELPQATAAVARAVTKMPLDGVTMSKMLLQAVLDAHGVGRDFDMAGFYASALWGGQTSRVGLAAKGGPVDA